MHWMGLSMAFRNEDARLLGHGETIEEAVSTSSAAPSVRQTIQ